MQTLETKHRLDVFDKKTRDIIEADMQKINNGKPYKSTTEALDRIEKKVSKMASDEDELFEKIYEKIQKQAEENDREYNQNESLARLMNIPDDMEYPCGDSDEEKDNESDSPPIRQRRRLLTMFPQEEEEKPRPQPKPTTVPLRRRNEQGGVNYSYYVLRVVFMIFLIFVVPFIQSYFKQ